LKYGLLVYKETDNIGDDIQSYSAERFLPQIDYFVDRENLHVFRTEKYEKIAVIMNAWYMHNKCNWPPSPYILPCFLSVHITKDDFFMIEDDFFSPNTVDYFSKYAPIGARDSSTLRLLQSHGIDSFFSACMTLTLEPDKDINREKVIYCVDVDDDVVAKVKNLASSCRVIIITHNMKGSSTDFCWEERRKKVVNLLYQYQKAQCVITTRLHCALPCLALGTPVLLLYNNAVDYKNRMEDYLLLLHHCSRDEFLCDNNWYDVMNPPLNKNLHIELRRNLIQRVNIFLNQVENLEEKISLPENYWYDQLVRQSELLEKQLPKLRKKADYVWGIEQAKNYYESQMEPKDSRIKDLEAWTEELEKAKKYLNDQLAFKDLRIKELEDWIEKIQDTREYLENQCELKNSRIKELEDWTGKLEEAKSYLNNQVNCKDLRIEELEDWISKLEEGKRYLESQLGEKLTT